MTLCFYCHIETIKINKFTNLCNKCNLVFIQDQIPYNIDDDKYEEFKNKF